MEKQMISQILVKILDKSTTIAVLLIAAWLLWGKMNAVEAEVRIYMADDRQKMIRAMDESTRAMKDCTRAIDRNSIIIDQLSKSN